MRRGPLIEIKRVDHGFFRRLDSFLPSRIVDIHTRVWLAEFRHRPAEGSPVRIVSWPDRVAAEKRVEDLLETHRLLFPGRQVTPVIFGMTLDPADDLEAGNAYIAACASRFRLPSLIFANPSWSAEEFESRIDAGGFLGAKVYLTWSDVSLSADQIQICDFLPQHQREPLIDVAGWSSCTSRGMGGSETRSTCNSFVKSTADTRTPA